MDYILKSIKASDKKGGRLKLTLLCDSGEKKDLFISESTYRKIGSPLTGYIIDGDSLTIAQEEDERYKCLIKAMSILSYGDNSEFRLKTKLKSKGFCPDAIDYALREVKGLSYLNEDRQIEIRIKNLSSYSLYGPIRICAKLTSEGYPLHKIKAAIMRLVDGGEISIEESRKRLLEKHCPESPEERRKILIKYGYIKN